MTPIHILTIAALLMVPWTSSHANMRALHKDTYQHSSSIKGEDIGITLDREYLSVQLPSMNLERLDVPPAKVTVAYELTSKKENTIPLLFIGVLIEHISIHVNGGPAPGTFISDPEELDTYGARYARHCADNGHCLEFHFKAGQFERLEKDPELKQKVGMVRFEAPVKKGTNTRKQVCSRHDCVSITLAPQHTVGPKCII